MCVRTVCSTSSIINNIEHGVEVIAAMKVNDSSSRVRSFARSLIFFLFCVLGIDPNPDGSHFLRIPWGRILHSASLDFVYSAIGHDCDLLWPSTLSTDVGNHVQCLDAVDDVSKDTRELGVHVCQDDAKLRRNLREIQRLRLV